MRHEKKKPQNLRIVSYEASADGTEEKVMLRYNNNTKGAISIRTGESLPDGFEAKECEILNIQDGKKIFSPQRTLTAQEFTGLFDGVNTLKLTPYLHGSLNGNTQQVQENLSDARDTVARTINLAKKAAEKETPVANQSEDMSNTIIRDGKIKHVSVLHASVHDGKTEIIGFSDRSIDIDPATQTKKKPTEKDFVDFSITVKEGEEPKVSFGDIMVDDGRFKSFENGKKVIKPKSIRTRIGKDMDIAIDRNYTGTECVNGALQITTDIFNHLGFNVNQR
jgi:hypothetical protein